ncbi:MAG: hypothetical protein HXM81_00190 [Neisseria sicca]|jgi:hypothetical protein|nr:hypothetical protein [Neisseria sicca]
MTNLYQNLTTLLNREQRGIAKITGDLGGGSWAAQTQSGGNIVLSGQTALNQRVFYDIRTNRIISQAPDAAVLELGV